MNKLNKYITSILTLLFIIFFDGIIYASLYLLGFAPFIEAFGMNAPEIPFGIFILFACMLHVVKAGSSNNKDSYDVDDPKLLWRLMSMYLSKITVIIILAILNFLMF